MTSNPNLAEAMRWAKSLSGGTCAHQLAEEIERLQMRVVDLERQRLNCVCQGRRAADETKPVQQMAKLYMTCERHRGLTSYTMTATACHPPSVIVCPECERAAEKTSDAST